MATKPKQQQQKYAEKIFYFLTGGNIAAAWAAIKALGQDGYINRARELMATTDKMKDRIKTILVKIYSGSKS